MVVLVAPSGRPAIIPIMPVAEGEVLGDKYRVERLLGQGGMGYVVAVGHLQLHERFAVKLLLAQALEQPSIVARFHREAQAAVRIKSEHVCRVIDVGMSSEHGPYMVMEYLEGEDLESCVTRRGPLPIPEAIDYVLQASLALGEAHGRGIVHRDLKPANLFLTRYPDGAPLVKVLDFGISKLMPGDGSGQQTLTATSMVMGSFAYMSPEQARDSKGVDARSDIWALGAILQKLMSARTPFEATTASAFIAKIVSEPPTPLRAARPNAPLELEAVILRCLEKDRAQRYVHVGNLARALCPFAPGSQPLVERIERVCGVSAQPLPTDAALATTPLAAPPAVPASPVVPDSPAADPSVAPWAPVTSAGAPRQRRSVLWAGAGGFAVAGLLAVIAWVANHPSEGSPNPAGMTATSEAGSALSPASTLTRDVQSSAIASATADAATATATPQVASSRTAASASATAVAETGTAQAAPAGAGARCTRDVDCSGSLVCVAGGCASPGTCTKDRDCPGNELCIRGRCQRP
jgi:serine/threonine protein kinase